VAAAISLVHLTAWAGPTLEVTATSPAAEKGHSFQIHVLVTTDQALTNVVITPIVPDGFVLEGILGEGLTSVKSEEPDQSSAVRIAEIPATSSITVAFRVYPPDSLGRPMGQKKTSYYSTREPKVFAFNFTAMQVSGGEAKLVKATKAVSLRYTTSIGYYLAAGMVGVLLGYLVKIATQYKDEINEKSKDKEGFEMLKVFLSEIFVVRSAYLLTLTVLGFGVLLVLSKESLPVSSWHQAIALGIAIGLFSDEQLISKFKI